MNKVLEKPWIERGTRYTRDFQWVGEASGSGFSFPCDINGIVDTAALVPDGLDNYLKCTNDTYDVEDMGVQTIEWTEKHRKIIECECGQPITLSAFTNTCECGADYNMSGSRLAPRFQWGEETGEHWTECYDGEDF